MEIRDRPAAADATQPARRKLGTARRRNVFVIGLNDFNRAKLAAVTGAERCVFHGLLEEPHHYDLPDLLAEAEAELRAFDGPIDAIVGYIDFPVSTMLPILCAHKYWARIEQAKAVPDNVPRFAAFDPFDDGALVASEPGPEEIADIERRFPGTVIQLMVEPGMRLSEMHEQDSYSYALALVYMGAAGRRQLLKNWRACTRALRFDLCEP